jgi:hypothetical protein
MRSRRSSQAHTAPARQRRRRRLCSGAPRGRLTAGVDDQASSMGCEPAGVTGRPCDAARAARR